MTQKRVIFPFVSFSEGIQHFFSNVHGSDGIFSLKSIQGDVTGTGSWIICRQSFIMLFPQAAMLVSSSSGEQAFLLS